MNCSGGYTTTWNHETYYVAIMDGGTTYYASRTLSWRWQRDPKLTENSRVKFAIENNTLILLDDEGHEFKMALGKKKRSNTLQERLEECRTTVQEMHEQHPDLPSLSKWLAALSALDLFNTHLYSLECFHAAAELKDYPMASQIEAIRAEMLIARAGAVPRKVTDDECAQMSNALDSKPMKELTEDDIRTSAAGLYSCAMQRYPSDSKTWFLETAQARQKLLSELVNRQTSPSSNSQAK